MFFCRCGEVVTKREQFNDLSIDLPRRKKTLPLRSIQDSLDLFFRVSLSQKQVLSSDQFLWKIHLWPLSKLVKNPFSSSYKKQASTRCITFECVMIEVTFSFCRWRKSSTRVKSAMGSRRLLCINSANCPGIYIRTIESEMHDEKFSHLLSNACSWTYLRAEQKHTAFQIYD